MWFGRVIGLFWRGVGLQHTRGLCGYPVNRWSIKRPPNGMKLDRWSTGGVTRPLGKPWSIPRMFNTRSRKETRGARRSMWECWIAKRTTRKMLGCMRRTCPAAAPSNRTPPRHRRRPPSLCSAARARGAQIRPAGPVRHRPTHLLIFQCQLLIHLPKILSTQVTQKLLARSKQMNRKLRL